jgi:hypothetical protein
MQFKIEKLNGNPRSNCGMSSRDLGLNVMVEISLEPSFIWTLMTLRMEFQAGKLYPVYLCESSFD